MTPEEAAKSVRSLITRRQALHEKATNAARSVVPVLLDSGRTESAKPLQELLFQLDALDQEMHAFIQENVECVVDGLLGRLH